MSIGGRETLTPQQRADIAASMQRTLEEYVLRLAGDAENICLGGGVAWNALLVSALEKSGSFKGVFAQPAAGNAGTALGVWTGALWGEASTMPSYLSGRLGLRPYDPVATPCLVAGRYTFQKV